MGEHELHNDIRAFHDCRWHLGGTQGDVARLDAEEIDWRICVAPKHNRILFVQ
jgi:hypothetical protein